MANYGRFWNSGSPWEPFDYARNGTVSNYQLASNHAGWSEDYTDEYRQAARYYGERFCDQYDDPATIQYQRESVAWGNQRQFFEFSRISYPRDGYPQSSRDNYPQSYSVGCNRDYYPAAKRTRWDASNNAPMMCSYNPTKRIQCYDCNSTFSDYKALYEHKDEKHKRKRDFYCSICNHCSGSYAACKKHEASHTIQACPKCPETFKFKDSLTAHVQHAHPVQPPVAEPIPTDIGAAPQSNCSAPEEHADTVNPARPSFSEPAAASTPNVEKKSQASTSNNSDSSVKNESFQCPYCIKSFESEKQMSSHCKIHTEADPDGRADDDSAKPVAMACPLCVKKFLSRRDLFIHMSSVHTQVFYCRKCPAEFSTQTELADHLEKEHGEKEKHHKNIHGKE